MAQDVDNSFGQPALGDIPEYQTLDEKSVQPDGSRIESHDDAHSTGLLSSSHSRDHDALAPSSSTPQMPDGVNVDNGEDGQQFGFKPRTIPGKCASLWRLVFWVANNVSIHTAWVRSFECQEDDDECEAGVTSQLLPSQPDDAMVAQHNHSPYAPSRPNYDYSEQGVTVGETGQVEPRRESRWQTFSRTIAYPRGQGVDEERVTPEWLNENHGDYSEPWRGKHEEGEDIEDPLKKKKRRQIWFKRFHNTLLESPIVPLIFRLMVWCFSLTALALGGSIQHLSQGFVNGQGPSALMAIIVDAVAMVYLVYITVDEYTSKPLGLRSPSAKARLILLDIFFIVFDSANLSLAFESLSTAKGSCTLSEINREIAPKNDSICGRQKALASVLLIALIAWLTTFSISVLR